VIYTGLSEFDNMQRGFVGGELIVLAARPAMGKTALALTLFGNNIAKGKKVLFFSCEMSNEQIANRLLSMYGKVPFRYIREPKLDANKAKKLFFTDNIEVSDELKKISEHMGCGAIRDKDVTSVESILNIVHEVNASGDKVDFIIVDYLQMLKSVSYNRNKSSGGPRTYELEDIIGKFKALAKRLNIPILLLAQTSREVDKRECRIPNLSDLKDSGSTEQFADYVIFLHREEYYLTNLEAVDRYEQDYKKTLDRQEKLSKAKGKADIVIAKNRNGKTGCATVAFCSEYMYFADL
jgi:replicative DNA helicase